MTKKNNKKHTHPDSSHPFILSVPLLLRHSSSPFHTRTTDNSSPLLLLSLLIVLHIHRFRYMPINIVLIFLIWDATNQLHYSVMDSLQQNRNIMTYIILYSFPFRAPFPWKSSRILQERKRDLSHFIIIRSFDQLCNFSSFNAFHSCFSHGKCYLYVYLDYLLGRL